ncbi:MAG: DUF1127 domain-containing protein [Paracoccaceae bacterium]|nr:DUF1127 domain-containing protein [Paracoccaceae bacterium]
MFELLKEKLAQAREVREIEAMDPRELDEIGLSRDDLINIAETPNAVCRRMEAMAAVHGIDAETMNQNRVDYGQLLAKCRHCGQTAHCADFLGDANVAGDGAEFCPNHSDYVALAAATH